MCIIGSCSRSPISRLLQWIGYIIYITIFIIRWKIPFNAILCKYSNIICLCLSIAFSLSLFFPKFIFHHTDFSCKVLYRLCITFNSLIIEPKIEDSFQLTDFTNTLIVIQLYCVL